MIGRVTGWFAGRPGLGWTLLGLSLLANAAFVVGFLEARSRMGGAVPVLSEQRAQSLARQLDLSPDQARRLAEVVRQGPEERQRGIARQLGLDASGTARFLDLHRSLRERMRDNAPEMRAARRAVTQAMLADAPDAVAIDRALAETERLRSEVGRAIARELAAFTSTLSAEQRQRLREIAERRGSWLPR